MLSTVSKQIGVLNDRLDRIYQMLSFIDEYKVDCKDFIDTTGFGQYFETMYSYILRYIVLEFFRMNDKSNDSISINKLKNNVINNFSSCFPSSNKDIYHHPNANITVDTMRQKFNEIYNKHIYDIQDKIQSIRNKQGLAHGQVEQFNMLVTMDELKELANAYKETLWIIDERLNNSHYAFGEGIIQYKRLTDLIKLLPKEKAK